MRIVLDAMGSDDCPAPEISGAIQAVNTFKDELILIGPQAQLQAQMNQAVTKNFPIRIIDAPEIITMEDKGLKLALKAKKKNSRTSMAVGIDLVKNGEADAFVTAGNTGGALATAYFRLGLLAGVDRPAITALFPVQNGHCVVLDIGANPEIQPENLLQFAIMGSVYAETVLAKQNPRVAILSNGEEAGKGNDLVKNAYPLLAASRLNFIGNAEAKDLFAGNADVVVTDGFTGNILLKASEAAAKLLTDILRKEITSSPITSLGGLLAKPAFGRIKKLMDPGEVGAAPLLGVNGLVFIGHGRSDGHAIFNSIRVAREAVSAGLLDKVSGAIQKNLKSENDEAVLTV